MKSFAGVQGRAAPRTKSPLPSLTEGRKGVGGRLGGESEEYFFTII